MMTLGTWHLNKPRHKYVISQDTNTLGMAGGRVVKIFKIFGDGASI